MAVGAASASVPSNCTWSFSLRPKGETAGESKVCLAGNSSDCAVETNASTSLTASLFETVWNSSSLDYTTSHFEKLLPCSFCS